MPSGVSARPPDARRKAGRPRHGGPASSVAATNAAGAIAPGLARADTALAAARALPPHAPPPDPHQQFRMEVIDVNPVSMTLLLSLRPAPLTAIAAGTSTSSALFQQGISVSVDGVSWKHVLMSDGSGASLSPTHEGEHSQPRPALNITPSGGEVVLVIFGLRPGRTCVVEVYIGAIAVASLVRRPRRLPPHERRALVPDPESEAKFSALQDELAHWETQRGEAQGRLRSARRDAAKSEQALRSNIEAARRARERAAGLEARARARATTLGEQVKRAQQAAEELRAQAEAEAREAARTEDADEARKKQLEEDITRAKDALAEADAKVLEAKRVTADLLADQTMRSEELEKQVANVKAEVDTKQSTSLPKLRRELDSVREQIQQLRLQTERALAPHKRLDKVADVDAEKDKDKDKDREKDKDKDKKKAPGRRARHARTNSGPNTGHGRRRDRGRHSRAQQAQSQGLGPGLAPANQGASSSGQLPSHHAQRSTSPSPRSSPRATHEIQEPLVSASNGSLNSLASTPRLNPKQPEFVPSGLHRNPWLGLSRSPAIGKLGPIAPPSSRGPNLAAPTASSSVPSRLDLGGTEYDPTSIPPGPIGSRPPPCRSPARSFADVAARQS